MTHDASNITAGNAAPQVRSLLNPSFIAETRELIEEATEGPWSAEACVRAGWAVGNSDQYICDSDEMGRYGSIERSEDAAFIAHARQALPLVLDAYEEAVREKDELAATALELLREFIDITVVHDEEQVECDAIFVGPVSRARAFLASQKEE